MQILWRWFFPSHVHVISSEWLSQQEHRESRVEHHGARMQWPIDKLRNESARHNAQSLKVRA